MRPYFELCAPRAHEKEFFIRKAIGWALREYSKSDAAAVRDFVARTELSPLAHREDRQRPPDHAHALVRALALDLLQLDPHRIIGRRPPAAAVAVTRGDRGKGRDGGRRRGRDGARDRGRGRDNRTAPIPPKRPRQQPGWLSHHIPQDRCSDRLPACRVVSPDYSSRCRPATGKRRICRNAMTC